MTPVEFSSADGTVRLHAGTAGPVDAPLTLLCLHGLTRNGADFGALVDRLSPRYRIVTADQRGRGRSQWDPDTAHYQPATYVGDMFHLLDRLAIERAVLIGTSMGGMMSMMMAATQPARIQALVLNDIGPEVPNSGLERLRKSLASPARIRSWDDAAAQAKRVNGAAFPDYEAGDWLAFARRTYADHSPGPPVLACDLRILEGLNAADLTAVPANLWSIWDRLAPIPTLVIRGELSDILSAEIVAAMAARHPNLITVNVRNRGHAPMLDEPEAVSAIDAFLERLQS